MAVVAVVVAGMEERWMRRAVERPVAAGFGLLVRDGLGRVSSKLGGVAFETMLVLWYISLCTKPMDLIQIQVFRYLSDMDTPLSFNLCIILNLQRRLQILTD